MSEASVAGAGSNGEGGLEAVDVPMVGVALVVAKDEVFADFDNFLLLPRAILPQSRGQQEVLAAILRQKTSVVSATATAPFHHRQNS